MPKRGSIIVTPGKKAKSPGFKDPKSNKASPDQIFSPPGLAAPQKGKKRSRSADTEPAEDSPSRTFHQAPGPLSGIFGTNKRPKLFPKLTYLPNQAYLQQKKL